MCVHDNTTETVGMCRENVDKLMKTKRSRVCTLSTHYRGTEPLSTFEHAANVGTENET